MRRRERQSVPARDSGTPELVMYKAKLVGGADPVLAENPLGVYFARRVITQSEMNAGMDFSRVYKLSVGGIGARKPAGGREISERELIAQHGRYLALRDVLQRSGIKRYWAVVNVAVYNRTLSETADLVEGLRAIVTFYKKNQK